MKNKEESFMLIPVPINEIVELLKKADTTAGKRFKELVFEQVEITLNKSPLT